VVTLPKTTQREKASMTTTAIPNYTAKIEIWYKTTASIKYTPMKLERNRTRIFIEYTRSLKIIISRSINNLVLKRRND
jgi:hypothetical protein